MCQSRREDTRMEGGKFGPGRKTGWHCINDIYKEGGGGEGEEPPTWKNAPKGEIWPRGKEKGRGGNEIEPFSSLFLCLFLSRSTFRCPLRKERKGERKKEALDPHFETQWEKRPIRGGGEGTSAFLLAKDTNRARRKATKEVHLSDRQKSLDQCGCETVSPW